MLCSERHSKLHLIICSLFRMVLITKINPILSVQNGAHNNDYPIFSVQNGAHNND